jgi:hypothetical protein
VAITNFPDFAASSPRIAGRFSSAAFAGRP